MDNYITLKNIEIFAYHGVHESEKKNGQRFLVTAKLFLNTEKATQNDSVSDTENYSLILKDIKEEFLRENYNLIETVADKLTLFLLGKYNKLTKAVITVKKPDLPYAMEYAGVTATREKSTVYIGLGANLGNKEENIKNALKLIDCATVRIVKVSSFYNTKPEGFLEQPDFLNACARIETILTPNELLRLFKETEIKLKRERSFKNAPRTIDIDILLFGNLITESGELTIPHPRMHQRKFVLEPLNEIAPFAYHPILAERVCHLFEEI
ncbi:MAG: 2-amino-4-hydroxy-6-hydroxymethyldihydropteridine diphosphokinase [Firmicutes bacterium]|nr:2-amino-4-hydroxy-6-hydroxymethyldihydropteridine diphosphokinase [Bacillota bacterium]